VAILARLASNETGDRAGCWFRGRRLAASTQDNEQRNYYWSPSKAVAEI